SSPRAGSDARTAPSGASGAGGRSPPRSWSCLVPDPQYRKKGLLWDLHGSHHLHPLLAFLLLLEKLALAGDVTAVALREHVLALCLHRLARDDLPADRRLDPDVEHLLGDESPQLGDEHSPRQLRPIPMSDDRERVDQAAGHEDVEADEIHGTVLGA